MNTESKSLWWNRWTACEVSRNGFAFRLLWLRTTFGVGSASVIHSRRMSKASGSIVPLYDADLNPINRQSA